MRRSIAIGLAILGAMLLLPLSANAQSVIEAWERCVYKQFSSAFKSMPTAGNERCVRSKPPAWLNRRLQRAARKNRWSTAS
jgi:hypothetical protein